MLIVTGTGRSGTGMLARLLGGHHEYRVSYLLEKYVKRGGENPFADIDTRLAAVLDLHQGIDPGTFIDVSNLYIHLLDAVWALHHPDVRFVLAVRHVMGFSRSAVRRGWHMRDSFDILPPMGSEVRGHWPDMSPMARSAWIWASRNRKALDVLEKIPVDRWMLLRVEDLAREDEMTRLAAFAGVRTADPQIVHRRINTDGPAEDEKIDPADLAAAKEIAGDLMGRFGYEGWG